VARIAQGKALQRGLVLRAEGAGLAVRQGLQGVSRRRPVGHHVLVVLQQAPHQRDHCGVPLGQQRRKHVQLLVLVVQGRRDVEVAQHVVRGLPGGLVAALQRYMRAQPAQQCQRALHPLVAGLEHGKGLLEAHGRGVETRKRHRQTRFSADSKGSTTPSAPKVLT